MSKKKVKDENVFLKARVSRKLYFPFYLMVIFLGALIGFLYFKGYVINEIILGIFVIFVFLVFNITETHRLGSSYLITTDDITCKYGILNKRIVKLDYFAISDLGANQNFWQWFLGFGDVDIKLFSKENSVSIKNINKPSKFVDYVENVMREKRK